MKRRILKYLLIGLLVLVLGGLWAFSTFFFNPFEGSYAFDLASLIPRDVDFYVSKADLRDDFDPFPRPAFATALEEDPHGQAFLDLQTVAGLLKELDVQGALAPLEESLAQLPVKADPLSIFGGKDLAIAGKFKGSTLADADWAVYGRCNWMGKLGVELVSSGLVDVGAQGFTLGEVPNGFSITGGQLTRTLFVTRILDVIVVSTVPDLVEAAHTFDVKLGEDSFGQSAKYFDNIASTSRGTDDVEVYLDYRALSETLKLPGTWPDPKSDDLATSIASKVFQAGTVRELLGTVGFGNGITVKATGLISSEMLTPFQSRLYRQSGFDKDEVLELAKMVPQDAGLFVVAHGPVGELLRLLLGSMEEALVSNVEDVIRSVWGYADAHPLIDDLDSAFKDRFAFFLRDHDYPPDEGEFAPIPNDVPVPAWAAIMMVDDASALAQIQERIVQRQDAFGIRGRQPGTKGVYENTVAGGGKIYEYHMPLVPGTGHLATLQMAGRGSTDYFVITNSQELLGSIFTTYRRRDYPGLSEQNWFLTLVNTGLPNVDLLAWANPRAVAETTRRIAKYNAGIDVLDGIDWSVERPRIEKEVLKEHFPGETWGAVSPENQDSYEMLVQQEADRFQAQYERQHLPQLETEYDHTLEAWELLTGALVEIGFDPKQLDLFTRAIVELQ